MGQLSAEERAALVEDYAGVVDPGEWRRLRDYAYAASSPEARRVLVPAVARVTQDPADVQWLKRAVLEATPTQRERWVKHEGPVRRAFFDHVRRRLTAPEPRVAREALLLARELDLNRGRLAEVLATSVREARSPATRALLFDYLMLWQPSRTPTYLEAIAAAQLDVSERAARELARRASSEHRWTPDAITRAETSDRAPASANPGGGTRPLPSDPATDAAVNDPAELDSERTVTSQTVASGVRDAEPGREVPNDEPAPGDLALASPAPAAASIPTTVTERNVEPSRPASGRWPLILYTAGAGALSFGTIGDIAFENDTAVAASALIGGSIGGAIPFLLTLERDVTLGDAAFIGSHASWAALAGYQGASLLQLDARLEQPRAEDSVAILTGLPALILSSLYFDDASWSVADAARVNALGLQVGVAAQSVLSLAAPGDPFERERSASRLARSALIAYGAGFLPASRWAAGLELDRDDRELLAYGTALGAGLGAGFSLSSDAELSRSRKLVVGAVGGQAIGFVGAMALTPVVDEFRAVDTAWLTALGAGTALGLAAVTPGSPEPRYDRLGLLLNGGALATVGLGVAFPHVLDWGSDAKGLTASFGGVGAVLGASLPLTDEDLGDDAPERIAGGAALGAGLGVLGASLLAPAFEATPESIRGGLGLTFYGTSLGTGLALALCEETCASNAIRGGQLGAVSGIAGAALFSDRFASDRASLSVGAAGAVWSAWNAGLLAEIVRPGLDTSDAGTVTAAAAVGGALLTALAEPLRLELDEILVFEALWGVRNLWGYTGARALGVADPRARLSLVAGAPLVGLAMTAAMREIVDLRAAQPWRYAALGGLGGLNGGLLARDARRGWGAAFGALTAASLTPISSAWLDDRELVEALLWSGVGNAMGAATGGLTERSRSTAAGLGGLLGVGAGGLMAHVTEYGGEGRLLLGVAASVGAAHAAGAAASDPRTDWAVLGAGLGLGYATLDTLWRKPVARHDLGEALVLTGLGDLAGWGLAESRGADPGAYVLVGGLSGFVLGHQLAPFTDHDARSALWAASVGTLGAASANLAAGDRGQGEEPGWTATVGGLGAVAALGVSQLYRPELDETVEAALWGGVGLGTASLLPRRRYRRSAGLLLGTLGGSVAAPYTDYSRNDALLMSVSALTGAALGAYAPDVVGDGLRVERAEAAGLGVSVALLASASASQWLEVEPRRVGDLGLSLAYSAALADGAVTLSPTEQWSAPARERARLAVTAGIMGGRLLLDDYVALDEWLTPTAFSLVGASVGAWTRAAVDRGEVRHGLQLGLGVGLGVGVLASGRLPGDRVDRVEWVAGSAIGQALGYGLADHRAVGAALGGIGGVGLATWLAPTTEYNRNDTIYILSLGAAGAGYGAWATGQRERAAGAAVGGALGLSWGAAATQWLDLSVSDLSETFALGALAHVLGHELAWWRGADRTGQAWASMAAGSTMLLGWPWLADGVELENRDLGFAAVVAGLGAWSGFRAASVWGDLDQDGTSRATALGASLGLAAGLTLSTSLELDADRVRGAAWGAGLGIGSGLAAGQLAEPTQRDATAAVSSIALGTVGGVAGAWLYPKWDASDLQRAALGFAGAGALGAGAGLLADGDPRWTVAALQLGGLTGAGLAGAYGDRLRLSGAGRIYTAAGSGVGGLNASWAARLSGARDRPLAGAALLGVSLGGAASLAVAQWTDLDRADVLETGTVSGLGLAIAHEAAWLSGASSADQQWAAIAAGTTLWLVWPFLAEDTELTPSDVGLGATLAGVGAWSGYQLSAALLDLDRRGQTRSAGLGAGVGLALGLGLSQSVELDGATVRYTATGAGVGAAVGYAAGQLALPADRAEASAVASVGLGVGGALFAARFGGELTVERGDAGLVATLGGVGAWHGAWASQLFGPDVSFSTPDRRRAAAGGAAAGAVLGTVAGTWLAQGLDFSGGDLLEASLGWGASASLGAGVGLLASGDDRLAVGLMHGTGLVGGLALARLAPHTELDGDEILVGSLTMSHLIWQGVGVGQLLDLEPREFAGTMLVATAGGGLLGAALGKRLQLDPAETWASFSGELWGSWLGAWIGFLYADEFSDGSRDTSDLVVGVSALAANVGLLGSSLALGGWESMTPARMGWVNLFGAAGALVGAAGGSLVRARNNVQKGNVVGTVLGLGAGVVVTGITGWGQSSTEAQRASASTARHDTGWLPELEGVMPQFSSLPTTDPDWLPENAEGFYLGVQGRWR